MKTQTKSKSPTAKQLHRLMRQYQASREYTSTSAVLPMTVLDLLPRIPNAQRSEDPMVWLRLLHYPSDSDWLVAGAESLGNGDTALWLNALLRGDLELAEWGCDGLAYLSSIKTPNWVEYDYDFSPMPWSQAREIYRQPRELVIMQQSPPNEEARQINERQGHQHPDRDDSISLKCRLR